MTIRSLLFLFSLTWLANCGGTAADSLISISPNEPFVLTVPRSLIVGDEILKFDAPNIAFQIKINNAGNSVPLTILGLTLTVDGPKGIKSVPIDPVINLFRLTGSNLVPNPRIFFAEVPAFQASYCMDKVNYFKETDASRTCFDIANDPSKVIDHGVSASNTVENVGTGIGTACCPAVTSTGNLDNIFVVIGGLQEYTEQEPIPSSISLSINANFQGFFGTFVDPLSNYSSQVFFNARAN